MVPRGLRISCASTADILPMCAMCSSSSSCSRMRPACRTAQSATTESTASTTPASDETITLCRACNTRKSAACTGQLDACDPQRAIRVKGDVRAKHLARRGRHRRGAEQFAAFPDGGQDRAVGRRAAHNNLHVNQIGLVLPRLAKMASGDAASAGRFSRRAASIATRWRRYTIGLLLDLAQRPQRAEEQHSRQCRHGERQDHLRCDSATQLHPCLSGFT